MDWNLTLIGNSILSSAAINRQILLRENDSIGTLTHTAVLQVKLVYDQNNHDIPTFLFRAGELYSEAADCAMAAMNGRLANKFYMLAEEAWSNME